MADGDLWVPMAAEGDQHERSDAEDDQLSLHSDGDFSNFGFSARPSASPRIGARLSMLMPSPGDIPIKGSARLRGRRMCHGFLLIVIFYFVL